MERPDLCENPWFDTNPHRIEHRDDPTGSIEKCMSTFHKDMDAKFELEISRVPHGSSLSPRDTPTHPYFIQQ